MLPVAGRVGVGKGVLAQPDAGQHGRRQQQRPAQRVDADQAVALGRGHQRRAQQRIGPGEEQEADHRRAQILRFFER